MYMYCNDVHALDFYFIALLTFLIHQLAWLLQFLFYCYCRICFLIPVPSAFSLRARARQHTHILMDNHLFDSLSNLYVRLQLIPRVKLFRLIVCSLMCSLHSTKATLALTTCYNHTNLNPHHRHLYIDWTQLTSIPYWQIFVHFFFSVCLCANVWMPMSICLLLLLFCFVLCEPWLVLHVGVNGVEYVLLCY